MQKQGFEYKINDNEEIPFYLKASKKEILRAFQQQDIRDESLLNAFSGDGKVVLFSVLNAWKFDFINEKMPPMVEILIDKFFDKVEGVEELIEDFQYYLDDCKDKIYEKLATHTKADEYDKKDYHYKTPPPHLSDDLIRELLCLDEWQQLQEQMRAYAKKVM